MCGDDNLSDSNAKDRSSPFGGKSGYKKTAGRPAVSNNLPWMKGILN